MRKRLRTIYQITLFNKETMSLSAYSINFYQGSAGAVRLTVPTSTDFSQNNGILFVVLTVPLGNNPAGMYFFNTGNQKWLFMVPLSALDLNAGGTTNVYFDITTSVVPTEGSQIYRNGVLYTGSAVGTTGGVVWLVLVPSSSGGSTAVPELLVFPTFASVDVTQTPALVNVLADETKSGNSSLYFYNGTQILWLAAVPNS